MLNSFNDSIPMKKLRVVPEYLTVHRQDYKTVEGHLKS